MDFIEVRVELGKRSYSVFIGYDLLQRASRFLPSCEAKKCYVLTDSNVAPLYLEPLERSLKNGGLEVFHQVIPAGETSKDLKTASEILGEMIKVGLTREDLMVALGGGVVGDIGGFVASIYKRGIKVLHVPTTLMAQVDSSIGGKTAVNLPEGKNMVGTFHQPVSVIADVLTLETLDEREFRSGLAEVAKYSFIGGQGWGFDMELLPSSVCSQNVETLSEVIGKCVSIKAGYVSEDEFDTLGKRAMLNYGHTLGHALEAASEYSGAYTHGESIAIGMVFASIVAEGEGIAKGSLTKKHCEVLQALGLPAGFTQFTPSFDDIFPFIERDKKSKGDIAMVLLEEVGKPILSRGISKDRLGSAYEELLRISEK